MGYLVGTDEAGYGPNLGPFVVSISVWQAPGDPCDIDLYRLLAKAVSSKLTTAPRAKGKKAVAAAATAAVATAPLPPKLAVCDSKLLYKPGEGLAALETGVLTALALIGARPGSWREAWQALDPRTADGLDDQPWHVGYEAAVPVHADRDHIDRHAERLRVAADGAQVRLVAVRSTAVFPETWNGMLEEHGNKSTVLSVLTLRLLRETLEQLDDEPAAVICDKHGGRNSYLPLLQQHATDYLVEVRSESQDESIYRWGPEHRRTQVRFCTKAERYLPTALASMASKYLRELAMLPFNEYWRRHVPDLKPTAGYPLDASRFKADIAAAQAALAIDDRLLWRNR